MFITREFEDKAMVLARDEVITGFRYFKVSNNDVGGNDQVKNCL